MAYTIDLSGKVVLVTGGASGIGYAIALSFLEAGAEVIVTARTEESIKNCKTITENGSLKIFKLDVRIGDCVFLEKGGEIIPKIVGVNLSKRNLFNSEKLVFISTAFADRQTNRNKMVNNFLIIFYNILFLFLIVFIGVQQLFCLLI